MNTLDHTDEHAVRGPFILLVPLLLAAAAAATSHAGVLALHVVDQQGAPLPCRVLVLPHSGGDALPDGATIQQIGPDRWFMSAGSSTLIVPDGPATVRVERGLEYKRFLEEMRIAGPRTVRRVTLRRWVDMRRRGYLCGENHLHVDTVRLAPMLVAEGLDFGTSLTWWRGPDPRRPIPPGAGPTRLLAFAGHRVPSSVYDAENEYDWGAVYMLHLPAPMPIAADKRRPNLDYVKHTVAAGGLVNYQAGWSREVLLDALLGYVHVVNVCNNNFALHAFQPRSRYSNLLAVAGLPVYPNTATGMMRMNTDTYYRLLNCGLRLAAGAGSATGVKMCPVGYNRAYVRVRPGATLKEFNQAWAAGKNFVTNGPMLELETADHRKPGATIELPKGGGHVRVHLAVRADQVITAAEVVVNGRVAAALTIDSPHRTTADVDLEIDRPAWIAARATARDDLLSAAELARYASGDKVQPTRLRFAHTSPIYVTVGGRVPAVRRSIDEGLRMLDRFADFARRHAGARYRPGILDAVAVARSRLAARKAAAAE